MKKYNYILGSFRASAVQLGVFGSLEQAACNNNRRLGLATDG